MFTYTTLLATVREKAIRGGWNNMGVFEMRSEPWRNRYLRKSSFKFIFLAGVPCLLLVSYYLYFRAPPTNILDPWTKHMEDRFVCKGCGGGAAATEPALHQHNKLNLYFEKEKTNFSDYKRTERRGKLRYVYMRRQCDNVYHVREYDPSADYKNLLGLRHLMFAAYSNDDHNFTIFTVMKVGSWHWNNLMEDLYANASPEFRKTQPRPLVSLRGVTEDVYLRRLRTHYKILFVRHPLSRALSAWRDKFVEHHAHWYRPWALRMIRMFRKHLGRADLRRPRPTALEFVRYITESGDDEVHWKPIWAFYRPCRIHFDFIGRLETLHQDVRFLMDKLSIEDKATYRPKDSRKRTTDLRMVRQILASVPQDIFLNLVKKYEEDFRLFGYHIPVNASDIKMWVD